MEYIKGKTLKELIQEKGKLSLEDTLNYSCQIADALEHAHENHIFHRDIKPHNIMITEDNRVKVTDFGIARAATSTTVTTTADVLGSVHYFSPEQARGGYTDDKSDIYSLGIVMYEMSTGKLPYEGETPITVALKHVQEDIVPPRELVPEIPLGFEKIILKCVQKRQAERYNNIGELRKDLGRIKINNHEELLDHESDMSDSHTRIIPALDIKEEVPMKTDKKTKKKKKHTALKVILLGVLLALVLASAIFYGYYHLKNLLNTEEATVPYVVGFNEDLARKTIEDLGLKFIVKDRIRNDNFEPGQVTYQSVDPDTVVKTGFPIEVTIADGEVKEVEPDKEPVPVPYTVHKSISDARELIMDASLKINIEYEYNDEVPADVVISQSPDPGSMVEPGTRINLLVSQGEDIKDIKMEKLVGQNIEEAKRIITRLDLILGDVVYQPDNEYGKDIVTWQSYEPGTEIQTKTTVDIYVSNGEKIEEEEVELEESALSFTLVPFQDREETHVTIFRVQDGERKEIYNNIHKAANGDIPLTVYGKLGSNFEIYYDDIYQTTIKFILG